MKSYYFSQGRRGTNFHWASVFLGRRHQRENQTWCFDLNMIYFEFSTFQCGCARVDGDTVGFDRRRERGTPAGQRRTESDFEKILKH